MLKIFIDGGAVGNPGPAGAGVVIYDEKGKSIKKISEFLGKETNNQAEYHALILALIWALELKTEKPALDKIKSLSRAKSRDYTSSEACPELVERIEKLEIYSDSELLVKQARGEYKIKNPNIKPLFLVAKFLLKFFDQVLFFNIPREKNKEADKLVKAAVSKFA